MAKTYYETLGVSESASPDEIKKSFRTLAKKYHPDRNQGDKQAEAKFKELSEAYETLSDPRKKQEYDTLRKYGAFQGAGAQGGRPGGFATEDFDFSQFFGQGGGRQGGFTFRTGSFEDLGDFEELFSSLFGGAGPSGGRRPRRSRVQKGVDAHAEVSIGFMEAVNGTERVISFQGIAKKLKVKIPRGINNGGQIRLAGQGQPGIHGGRNGDLIITVRVMPDQNFDRRGNDIYTSATISFKDAILGCKANVKTLTRTIALTIPPGTQPGTVMRLKGQGLAVGSAHGDQYVEIKVTIPKNVTEKQRKLLEEWGE